MKKFKIFKAFFFRFFFGVMFFLMTTINTIDPSSPPPTTYTFEKKLKSWLVQQLWRSDNRLKQADELYSRLMMPVPLRNFLTLCLGRWKCVCGFSDGLSMVLKK
ncbi:MAG: hypothetical protein CM15mP58_18560 [Burkholderiaceae bacterium]|nr:MAG: hypothetical protein CM15mP58_18560 [Burkholderiaceae bacterium]